MKFIANIQGQFAMMSHHRNKIEKALVGYEKAYEGGTNNSAVLAAYGLLLLRRGEFKESREVLKSALKVVNKKKPVHRLRILQNLGLAYWKMGNIDRALEIYQKIYDEYKSGMVYGTMGFFMIAKADQTGDYEEALKFNLEALDYDDDAVVLDNLGQLYWRMGEYDTAEEYLRKALEKNENQFDTLVCLTKCTQHKGDLDEAKSLIKRALERPFSHLNTVPREEAEKLAQELGVE